MTTDPPRQKRILKLLPRFIFAFILLGAILFITAKATILRYDEHERFTSPDGKYIAVLETQRWHSMIPRGPGSGSDSPGIMTIYNRQGESFGSIPLPMLWMGSDVQWHDDHAEIRLVGRWSFEDKSAQILEN